MLQYCRYCGHMVCGDANYCREKKRFFSDKQICAANKCKQFDLNPIDALGINKNEYKSREKTASEDGQINIFESEEMKNIEKCGEWEIDCDGYYLYYSACGNESKSGTKTETCETCGAIMKNI